MSEDKSLEALVGDWVTLPDVAEKLDVIVTKVHNYVKERRLVAVRIGENNIRMVPAKFLTDKGILPSVKGTATVLADAGFDDEGIIRWMFTDDDSLPGRPIDALLEGRKSEIRRRAQALAW